MLIHFFYRNLLGVSAYDNKEYGRLEITKDEHTLRVSSFPKIEVRSEIISFMLSFLK